MVNKSIHNELFYLCVIIIVVFWIIVVVRTTKEVEPTYEPVQEVIAHSEPPVAKKLYLGTASWYDYDINQSDQKCRDENCYSKIAATCASREFPRGSLLEVRNLGNNKTVICRVNDYIEHPDRRIDLSSYAFRQIAPLSIGLVDVEINLIK